ncbi:hypothetical protein [Leucobacter musarum]|uniref:hypothetical protein n=1 Tax=Leucobacter musarum TaxID=1930747 RepID=UPI000A8846D1|nr:hypothetical protein [Leucobacter musarum]
MRHAVAIAVLVVSGVLILLGLGQRTFLAGPAEISFPVDTQSESPFAVVNGSEFTKLPGQANVVVSGQDAFVATAMTRDVEAWVDAFPHAELSVDQRSQRLLSALIPAAVSDAPTAGTDDAASTEPDSAGLDPRGSDLWLESRSIDDAGNGTENETLRVPVALAKDQSVIIATNGTDPIPSELSLVWVQDRSTPLAGPFLAGGALLAIVGAVLYLLAVDHDRRGLGPRRGRRGPLQGIRNAFGGRGRRSASASGAPDTNSQTAGGQK